MVSFSVGIQTSTETAIESGGRSLRGMNSRWRIAPGRLIAIVTLLAVAAGLLRVVLHVDRASGMPTVHGISLGMSPMDVRARFRADGPGHWRAVEASDPALEWWREPVAHAPAPTSAEARFEFHGGILAAARFALRADDPDAQGAPIDVSSASVLARAARTDGRVELTLLALDCPTHAEEVHRLLSRR